VVTGLALSAVILRPCGNAPAPLLGGPAMGIRDLAAALLFGQQAVQLESGPPVHEHRRRIRGGIGHQQPGPAARNSSTSAASSDGLYGLYGPTASSSTSWPIGDRYTDARISSPCASVLSRPNSYPGANG